MSESMNYAFCIQKKSILCVPDKIGNSNSYYSQIDSIRGVAAISVFAHHLFQQFFIDSNFGKPFFLHMGSWGVSLFFIISGFCIHSSAISQTRKDGVFSAKKYLRKRFLRIYPLFIFTLLVCYVLGLYANSGLINNASIRSLFEHMFLLSSFDQVGRVAINAVVWSVIVECHFYLLYLVLRKLFVGIRRTIYTLIISFTLSLLIGVIVMSVCEIQVTKIMLVSSSISLLWQWILGVLLAQLVFSKKRVLTSLNSQGLILIFWFAVAVSIAIGYTQGGLLILLTRYALPFVLFIVLYGVVRNGFSFVPNNSVTIYLGQVSYSIYLLHPIAIFIVVVLGVTSVYSVILLSLILCIVFSAIGWYLIEKRCMYHDVKILKNGLI